MTTSNKLASVAVAGLLSLGVMGASIAHATELGKVEKSASVHQLADKHACKGQNACKGQGGDGKNECKGKGSCATDGSKK